ncbi:MAG: hypothetical protein GY705_06955 [Bacteroidetes bacterium]|nr:hypothetical protein [Bacteroidota bacterium]
MKKVHFAAFSDYILDYCHECGSMFFDKNEFNVTKDNFARITGNNSIRTYEKDRFLSIEKLLNSVPFGRSESLSTFFRVTLFFKSPLSFSLRITKEKWLTKFQKVFGILKGKDIEIWDPLFDQKFLIQGDKEHKIRQLLNNKYLKGELVKLFEKRFSIVHLKGTIEITESGLRYCEGPYGHIKELNLKNATRPIVDEFMHIADIIEELDH